ncbi:BglG family transcription antiterminator [Streptococcus dentasini]
MLNKRQEDILHYIEDGREYVTIETIANNCGLSKRTIHSELQAVSNYLEQEGRHLEKKRGVGITIKDNLEKSFDRKSETISPDVSDVLERRMEIMRCLLFDNKYLTYQYLSDLFFVSKTSIVKDFEFIMSVLGADSAVSLTSNRHGTKLQGTEADFQTAMLQFNRFVMSHAEIYADDMLHKNIDILSIYYGDDIVKTCKNIFYSYIRKYSNVISDHYVQNVLSIFIILTYRSSEDNHHLAADNPNKVSEKFFEDSAEAILDKVTLRLGIHFTSEDKQFFSKHLVLNRFEGVTGGSQFTEFADRLLQRMTDSLKIDFLSDEKLVKQLKDHIPAMMYRLQSNMTVENPFTSQIKREFSLMFNLISMVIVEIESDYQVVFNENEIAFLTTYFQSAIERAKINKRILVVCQMGIATSELLVNRIKKALPSIDTIELSSVAELEYLDITVYDFVISTVHLDIPDKNIIFVSPFLTKNDIERIKAAGYTPSLLPYSQAVSQFHHLFGKLSEDSILLNTAFEDRKGLFKEFGRYLVEKGYVAPEFIGDLFHREQLGATDLPVGVAIPHGNPQHIKQTQIFLLRNKKKIRWDKYQVDIIFMICVCKDDLILTRGILTDIYNIIDNPKLLKLIRHENQSSKLLKHLQGGH